MLDALFVGDLNVDVVLSGVKQLPQFGRETLCEDYRECAGGSTGSCACAAATLGLKAAVYDRLGTDHFGEIVLRALRRAGLETRLLELSEDYRTGVTVSLSSSRDRAMVTCFGDSINGFDAEEIPLEAANARHLHAGSYFLQPRMRKNLAAVFQRAQEAGMTTSLDAGWDENGCWHDALDQILPFTDYFFPNESEAEAITGCSDPLEGARQLAALGCNAVVKCGGTGSIHCARGSREATLYPAYKTRVADTTGAGDSFNAGFLYARLRGMEIPDCMRMGNAVGALSVQRIGGSDNCPTLAEALRTIESGSAL